MNLTKKHVGRWVPSLALGNEIVGYSTEADAVRGAMAWAETGCVFAVLACRTQRGATRYGWEMDGRILATYASQQDALRDATVSETAWQIVAVYEVVKTAKKIGGAE